MPFLRITRDKRGYENTFVMHASRTRGRNQPRVLYWFRTPPGVRVGRSALDEDAIRAIETTHPDIEFDWKHILDRAASAEPLPSTAAPPGRRRDRKPGRATKNEGASGVSRRDASREPEPAAQHEASAPEPAAHVDIDREPAVIDSDSEARAERHPALEELVGTEGVARLRARFSELRARISDHSDEAERQELRTESDSLDPDTWVTVDEAREGLEGFEQRFEAIRRRLPASRRGRRRRGRSSSGGQKQAPVHDSDGSV